MPTEDIIVNVKTVSQLKGLIQTRDDMRKLEKVGIRAIGGRLRDMNGKFIKTGDAVKRASGILGRFKFELLGVLFFGMAVSKFLSGLLKPAFDVAEVFTIMNDTLALFFLPTAIQVSDVLLSISEKLAAMPEPVQQLVGDLTFLTSGMFQLLSIIGQVGLGLASVKILTGLTGAATLLLFGKFLLIGAVIIGLIILYKNWTKISDRLKVAIGATAIVLGIVLFAINPVAGAVALLIGAFILLRTGYDKLKDKFGTTTFFDTFKAALNVIIDKINEFLILINMIPGIDIPGIPKFSVGSPEDVIGVSDELANIDSNIPRTNKPFKIGDSFFDITINTTNGINESSLKDELINFMNETSARGTQNVSGNR